MKTFMLITLCALALLATGCGQQPAADTAVALDPAVEAVITADEEVVLAKLETAAPAYAPVTRDNYPQLLAQLEAEVAAEMQQ